LYAVPWSSRQGTGNFPSRNSIRLSAKETSLMELLMLNEGKAISREHLFQRVWQEEPDKDPQIVWIYISYLREKLKAIGSDREIIGEEEGPFTLKPILS
jgi:two-component system, OmpR family, manganese sensing response regulator